MQLLDGNGGIVYPSFEASVSAGQGTWMFVPILTDKTMSGKERASIKPGQRVRIVLKADQRSGKLTEGIVRDILTSSPTHPHGIKVRLVSGEIGRVKEVL